MCVKAEGNAIIELPDSQPVAWHGIKDEEIHLLAWQEEEIARLKLSYKAYSSNIGKYSTMWLNYSISR